MKLPDDDDALDRAFAGLDPPIGAEPRTSAEELLERAGPLPPPVGLPRWGIVALGAGTTALLLGLGAAGGLAAGAWLSLGGPEVVRGEGSPGRGQAPGVGAAKRATAGTERLPGRGVGAERRSGASGAIGMDRLLGEGEGAIQGGAGLEGLGPERPDGLRSEDGGSNPAGTVRSRRALRRDGPVAGERAGGAAGGELVGFEADYATGGADGDLGAGVGDRGGPAEPEANGGAGAEKSRIEWDRAPQPQPRGEAPPGARFAASNRLDVVGGVSGGAGPWASVGIGAGPALSLGLVRTFAGGPVRPALGAWTDGVWLGPRAGVAAGGSFGLAFGGEGRLEAGLAGGGRFLSALPETAGPTSAGAGWLVYGGGPYATVIVPFRGLVVVGGMRAEASLLSLDGDRARPAWWITAGMGVSRSF